MKTNLIQNLTDTFEAHRRIPRKRKTACEVSGHTTADHFSDVRKMVKLGSGSHRELDELRSKDFAAEITIFNAKERQLNNESAISYEHITNNQAVRKTLLERGIRPESLSPAEDVKKVEHSLVSEKKGSLKNPDGLDS